MGIWNVRYLPSVPSVVDFVLIQAFTVQSDGKQSCFDANGAYTEILYILDKDFVSRVGGGGLQVQFIVYR